MGNGMVPIHNRLSSLLYSARQVGQFFTFFISPLPPNFSHPSLMMFLSLIDAFQKMRQGVKRSRGQGEEGVSKEDSRHRFVCQKHL